MNPKPIRVLIVDDSSLARKMISNSLAPFRDIEIAGTAADPYIARDKILELKPDVMTLDLEMPRMDGIAFLKILMQHHPLPVIIMSSLTHAGSYQAFEALQAGAVDIMAKPAGSNSGCADGAVLAEKIRAAAAARLCPAPHWSTLGKEPRRFAPGEAAANHRYFPARKIILLGASTGGTEALKVVLTSMGGDLPGICIVQHIPAHFSRAFAHRLNQICPMEVREAQSGDVLQQGLALVAPGGQHVLLKWREGHYVVELNDGPPVHHQKPAIDILFDSAIRAGAGPYASAAILTGMGSDGAVGLLRLREAGAATVAQNEETCVVFGMPREAIQLGAAQQILPLSQIGPFLDQAASQKKPAPATARSESSHRALCAR